MITKRTLLPIIVAICATTLPAAAQQDLVEGEKLYIIPEGAIPVGTGADGQTFYLRPGRPDILKGRELGANVGRAQERATAYRGPYGFGECPANTILTTFGTCARLK